MVLSARTAGPPPPAASPMAANALASSPRTSKPISSGLSTERVEALAKGSASRSVPVVAGLVELIAAAHPINPLVACSGRQPDHPPFARRLH